jgi:dipeptidyl-peptidase-4
MTWATCCRQLYAPPPVARDRFILMKTSFVRIAWNYLSGVLWFGVTLTTLAQSTETNSPPRLYRDKVEPHWFADNQRFWYRNDLRGGAREFVVVDAGRGKREPAFDHEAIARQIGNGATATKLPFTELNFSPDGATVKLAGEGKSWVLNLKSGKLEAPGAGGAASEAEPGRLRAELRPRPSTRTGLETQITFENTLNETVEVFWLDDQGERTSYGTMGPNERKEQHTFSGHVWLVANRMGEALAVYEATDSEGLAVIGENRPGGREGRRSRRNPEQRQGNPNEATSPDGKWFAFLKEQNVFVRGTNTDATPIQLSTDGKAGNAYGRLEWSPDSQKLVAWRIEPGDRKEVHLVRSSPRGGGRATLTSRPYPLPGDKFAKYEPNVFDVATRAQTKLDVDRFEHEWLTPDLHWWPGTSRFAYTQDDRGHQRYRVIEVDAAKGTYRTLIEEKSKTFIWTTHAEGPERLGFRIVTWLDQSQEIIHMSEQDGWRHMYLVDGKTGKLKNQITKGEWVVRGIDRVDEEKRQVWFKASGKNAGQDPYLIHFYRINFDGSGLVALTEGDGNHTIAYSPDGKYLIDTYSRVDLPPVNELRRTSDGKLVCALETADISALKASGWQMPEVFSAKGRDGKTDIWGVLHRPAKIRAGQKLPIIEDVYAGPQDSFVPKTFSTRNRYDAFTELGFAVVKIDGMGTANRSKAFHDVCFKNLKDGGFPDRIVWMQAAAKKYPSLDVTRVGIYGTSAGGQNAAGAVLFHPEFYKAAAANCGCHDNRMDKASWNEQWMGYMPVEKIYEKTPDNWYARSSNIDNADKLQGHLFLVVGEVDDNVPPESTYRFVDALIQAKKDFDFLLVPNGGHGAGGAYYQRRLQDFFVRHLMNVEPPNRNEPSTDVPAGS